MGGSDYETAQSLAKSLVNENSLDNPSSGR